MAGKNKKKKKNISSLFKYIVMLKTNQIIISLFILLFSTVVHSQSTDLYKTIVHMDSVFFNAYNTCDIQSQASIYSDSIEFYHEKGGLMTSKKDILDATKKTS